MPIDENCNKRIAKNTLFMYIRMFVTMCIGLYTSRVVLQLLGIEDYGLYNLVGGFVSFLVILTASLGNSSSRFLTYSIGKNDREILKQTFCTTVSVLFIVSLLFFVIGGVIGIIAIYKFLNIPDGKHTVALFVFLCTLGSMCIDIMAIPYNSLINAHEKMDYFAFVGIFESIAKLLSVLLLFIFENNRLYYYAVSLMIISIVVRFANTIYCKYKFEEAKYSFKINKSIFKQIFNYSVWIGLGSFSGILKDQGGNILVNLFWGISLNASYGICNQVRGIVSKFGNGIGAAIAPQITKSYAAGNVERSIKLTFFKAKIQGLLMIFIAIPIIVQADYILDLWLDFVPDYAVVFVQLGIICCILQTVNMCYGTLFLAIGKIKDFQIICSGINILYIPICYMLYSYCSVPEIAMYVTVALETFFLFFNYAYLNKLIDFPVIKFYKDVLSRLFIVFILCYIIADFFKGEIIQMSFLQFIFLSILICFCNVVIIFIFGLNKKEILSVGNIITNKIKMYKRS